MERVFRASVVGDEEGPVGSNLSRRAIILLSGLTALYQCAAVGATTVITWGNSAYGQAGIPTSLSGVVALAAGALHSLALKDDGTVVAWGDDSVGQTEVPSGLANVSAIAAVPYRNIVLKRDGSVVNWGFNTYDQTGVTGVVAVATAGAHNLTLLLNGSVVGWGYARYAHGSGQWQEFLNQTQLFPSTNFTFFGGVERFNPMVRTAREQAKSK